jgi:deoxyribodipyrimidine photo-lyase
MDRVRHGTWPLRQFPSILKTDMTTIVWFRQDLRIRDNPALQAAAARGPVLPVYIDGSGEDGDGAMGAASRWWLHHSLQALDSDLGRLGSRLCLRRNADAGAELRTLAQQCGAQRIVWNRRYEPAAIAQDQRIKAALRADGFNVESFNGTLLREPWEVLTKTGGPFQVFTPFWRHCLAMGDPPPPAPVPARLTPPVRPSESLALDTLALLPRIDWAQGFSAVWTPGSAGAQRRLETFLEEAFDGYAEDRNRPDLPGTSRLSPHLHFGEIGPREVFHALAAAAGGSSRRAAWRQSAFLAELGWREFAYHLLYHFPATPHEPLRANFARFPWADDPEGLRAWQQGSTGYPIVDAGMRELWSTGWMHNRVRMIAASFLVKDLLLPWTCGAGWFWDCLVDADLASNTLGWQWVAGCGADAAPYFRVFNPVLQGRKFDPEGAYVRRWVPELAQVPTEWLHAPWEAPGTVLADAGVRLGTHYPGPIVDHESARRRALAALATLKSDI